MSTCKPPRSGHGFRILDRSVYRMALRLSLTCVFDHRPATGVVSLRLAIAIGRISAAVLHTRRRFSRLMLDDTNSSDVDMALSCFVAEFKFGLRNCSSFLRVASSRIPIPILPRRTDSSSIQYSHDWIPKVSPTSWIRRLKSLSHR